MFCFRPSNNTPTQAFDDISKGEHTANALEAHLEALESKLESLLTQVEKQHDQNERKKTKMKSEQSVSVSYGKRSDENDEKDEESNPSQA